MLQYIYKYLSLLDKHFRKILAFCWLIATSYGIFGCLELLYLTPGRHSVGTFIAFKL